MTHYQAMKLKNRLKDVCTNPNVSFGIISDRPNSYGVITKLNDSVDVIIRDKEFDIPSFFRFFNNI